MSGRSAYVRAKKHKVAEEKSRGKSSQVEPFDGDGFIAYGMGGQQAPTAPLTPPYGNTTGMPRRMSVSPSISSDGGDGNHPGHVPMSSHSAPKSRQQTGASEYPPPPKLPRPIIVSTAIEKSNFRGQVDGMSKNVRSRAGKLVGKTHDVERLQQLQQQPHYQRPPQSSATSNTHTSSSGITRPSQARASSAGAVSPGVNQFALFTSANIEDWSRRHPKGQSYNIRRFEGGKRPQIQWSSLAHTSTLNDEGGDTSVFMYTLGSPVKPSPSFRVDSRVIRDSGSKKLIDQLQDRSVPAGWPRLTYVDVPSPESSAGTPEMGSSEASKAHADYDDASYRPIESYTRGKATFAGEYEIYLPYPGDHTGVNAATWHMTTRNFFAMLYDDPAICGTSLYEALVRVLERLQSNPDYLDRETDHVAFINSYLTRNHFDNVTNLPSPAVSILAWSEVPEVQWREGYLEAFVHCAGMYEDGVQEVPEWRHVSSRTKILLLNAKLEMDERYHRAQKFLGRFDFGAMWPSTMPTLFPERLAFDRLRHWLCKYYEQRFPTWPLATTEQSWLTREILQRLSKDIYGLYDYLVDRNIMFDGSEYRGRGRNWVMTSLSGPTFHADSTTLPLTRILVEFDDRFDFPHLPYPYTVTPPSIPATPRSKGFTMKRADSAPDLHAQSRRKALAYSEASNVYILRGGAVDSDLVADFIQFEQTDQIEAVDPFEARRGRWILVYGILQILATVAVDSPHLRHTAGAVYHLSAQMKGLVPWAPAGAPPEPDAAHTLSHPFTIPDTWPSTVGRTRNTQHRPIIWGQYGDGRARGVTDEPPLPGTGHSSGSDRPALARDHEPGSPIKPTSKLVRSLSRAQAPDAALAPGTPISENRPQEGKSAALTTSTTTTRAPGSMTVQEWLEGTRGDASGPAAGSREARWSGSATALDGESTNDAMTQAEAEGQSVARRKRAMVHGFTDFKVPEEW